MAPLSTVKTHSGFARRGPRQTGRCRSVFMDPNFGPRLHGRRRVCPWAQVSECEYRGPTPFARHEHDIAYLGLVLRGGYRERYIRDDRTARAGSVIFYAQGESHEGTIPGVGARLFHLELDPRSAPRDEVGVVPAEVDEHALGAIVGLMIRLRQESELQDDCSSLAREAIVHELLDRLARESVRSAGAPRWLARIREQIHDRARDALSLGELAEDAGRHPSHVARTFSDRFGCSIGAYQRRLRVANAARSIGAGASLSEAALRTGFADQAHLTRIFKSETGLTPGAYRRAVRG